MQEIFCVAAVEMDSGAKGHLTWRPYKALLPETDLHDTSAVTTEQRIVRHVARSRATIKARFFTNFDYKTSTRMW